MNFEPLDNIIAEARRDDLSLAERAGLYAAASTYFDRIEMFVGDHYDGNKSYTLEKLHSARSSLSIILGFNIYRDDNPHEGVWRALDGDWYKFKSNLENC